ncbi:MAG: nucleotide sugar dehydrogenase [Clostridiales bacterium]|nr:nucleotide sugar dehydrogenase [Clostridiales bacterium]
MVKTDGTAYTVAVAGIGYVGLSMAVLLSQHNKVIATDIDFGKVDLLNRRVSAIEDKEIKQYLRECELNLSATVNAEDAYAEADYILICTPTNFNDEKGYFDTSSVEAVLSEAMAVNPSAVIVIKSTVPVGYTKQLAGRYPNCKIIFSPEFLREGKALYDNLHPSRIIVGTVNQNKEHSEAAHIFASMLQEAALDKKIPVLFPESSEAEAVKLFSNAYLAMRIAFFNELDSFAELNHLDSANIIDGMGMDSRIGKNYNNPSFGYGGYCLPKDTKQLVSSFGDAPKSLISAIVQSNAVRKDYIAENILKMVSAKVTGEKKPVVGVYQLAMKSGSDNLRNSAVCDVVKALQKSGRVEILIYENNIPVELKIEGVRIASSLKELKADSDLIIANRCDEKLTDVAHKLYTRDIYNRD